MTWFVYALIAAILMTFVNFGDKFVVESQVPNPLALIIFLAWFNLFISIVLWIFLDFKMLLLNQGMILIFAGTAPAFGGYFYFQAVARTETTRIVILSQLQPLFTLMLSMLFLNERLTAVQFIGFALIIIAAIAVTIQKSETKVGEIVEPVWGVLFLMMMTNLIYGAGLVLADSVVESVITDLRSLLLVTAYSGFGYWLGSLVLYLLIPQVRQSFGIYRRRTGIKAILSLSSVETLFVIRQIVLFLAITLGSVSLVSVIGSLNVFFAITLGWILTLWQPHIFKEDISRSNLLSKFLWAGVAFVGIILLR